MPKQAYSIDLEERQYKFLEEMVNEYALPDVGKAIRCLVDFAAEDREQREQIFQEIRCLDC